MSTKHLAVSFHLVLQKEVIVAPIPSFSDSMYNLKFWDYSEAERNKRMHRYEFCLSEAEPLFDAADISRVGKDIFVQKSMTTNDAGIAWIKKTFPELRVHPCHFPYDLYPSHIDCTFVPLRPPTSGSDGLVLINPERPPLASESKIWLENGWKFINAPKPAQSDRPSFSQSSAWLSMNILSLSTKCVVAEENETELHRLLESYGFDVITVPFRHVYEFGGGLHCATWDIKRNDSCMDYFPNQEFDDNSVSSKSGFSDITCIDVRSQEFVLNPQ
jgi:glycine amidinotransferase